MKLRDILTERIFSDGDQLKITVQHSREASSADAISTFIKNAPYHATIGEHGYDVYSILNYLGSPESTKLLSSLKGKGPYTLNHPQLNVLLDHVTDAMVKLAKAFKANVILYPASSSPLVMYIAERLRHKLPGVKFVHEAFHKAHVKDIDVEHLLNTTHPQWEKFIAERPKEAEAFKASLKKQLGHDGTLELKKLYKPYLKFVKNFIKLTDHDDILEAVGRNVLVLDDILSSGSTMVDMIRQISELEPTKVAGLTMFKRADA